MADDSADPLAQYLSRWERRRRTAQSLGWGAWGLAAGLFVDLLITVAARIWPLLALDQLLLLAALWGVVGALGAVMVAWLWPRSDLEQARFFDQRLGLQERISTAWEVAIGSLSVPAGLRGEQWADAVASAARADVKEAIPMRMGRRELLPALLCLVALAATLWLPNPMQEILTERAAVREDIAEQIQEMVALREEIATHPQLSDEDQSQLLALLDGAIEKLESSDLTREEALAELTDTADRLRDLTSDTAEQQGAALQAAAEGLSDASVTNALAQALTGRDYHLASDILRDLSNEIGEVLTREQELELAGQLAESSASLADSNPALADQFAAAAEAIQAGDIAAARQALAQASGSLGQTGQRIAVHNAADKAAGRLTESGQQFARIGGQQGEAGDGSSPQLGEEGQGGGAGRGEGDGAAEGGPAGPMDTDNAAGDGGIRAFESIYAPRRLGGEGGPQMELPQSDELGVMVRELMSEPETGQSTVPYNTVYATYVDSANVALLQQQIPLGLRSYVRDYFSSLEP